jgi:hypothetical protein
VGWGGSAVRAGLWFDSLGAGRAFARLPRRGRLGLRGLGGAAVRGRAVVWEVARTWASFARLPRRGRLGLRGLRWIGGSWLGCGLGLCEDLGELSLACPDEGVWAYVG